MDNTLGTAMHLAGNLPGLLVDAEKIAHTFMRGVHGRRRTGQGETFWQFRHYQPGDSSRAIDWRQTAKRDDAYVRELEWEAAQTVWLYRDASASMDFRSENKLRTKKEYAEILLLALAIVVLNGGEQAGLIGTDLLPQMHEGAINRIAAHLPQQKALAAQGRPISARSEIALIGDFYEPVESIATFCAAQAERGATGVLLQICDPAEEELSFDGRVKFIDAENEAAAMTVSQVSQIRDAYREKFIAHRAALENMTSGIGWRFLHARTDDKIEETLARLYDTLTAKRKA